MITASPAQLSEVSGLNTKSSCALIKMKILEINRSIPLTYPPVLQPLHPELEHVGPSRFSMLEVELYLHPKQKTSWVEGRKIYEHLIRENILGKCLGLRELQEIQKKMEPDFVERHFNKKLLFAWKGIARKRDHADAHVPFLSLLGDEIALEWLSVNAVWNSSGPALCFHW